MGETITVQGPVITATWATASNGQPTFLNVGRDYPDPTRFIVVIWAKNRSNFSQAPESMYADKIIRVTGAVSEYDGSAQIEATSESQIEIVSPPVDYRSVSFIDASHGWATGMTEWPVQFVLMQTSDGGTTWTRCAQRQPVNGGGFAVHFVTPRRGLWLAALMYASNDGGQHWRLASVPGAPVGWTSVSFADKRVGWLGGVGGSDGTGRYIAQTLDGGASWHVQVADYNVQFGGVSDICAAGPSDAFALSNGLWATHDGGKTWSPVSSNVSGSNHWTAVCFKTPLIGWSASDRGTIFGTRDGGLHWAIERSGSKGGYYALDFVSPTTGWAVGPHGTIVCTRDGGDSWVSVASGTTQNLYAVDFIDASRGWVAGDGGVNLRTTDGGRTWQGVQ